MGCLDIGGGGCAVWTVVRRVSSNRNVPDGAHVRSGVGCNVVEFETGRTCRGRSSGVGNRGYARDGDGCSDSDCTKASYVCVHIAIGCLWDHLCHRLLHQLSVLLRDIEDDDSRGKSQPYTRAGRSVELDVVRGDAPVGDLWNFGSTLLHGTQLPTPSHETQEPLLFATSLLLQTRLLLSFVQTRSSFARWWFWRRRRRRRWRQEEVRLHPFLNQHSPLVHGWENRDASNQKRSDTT